MSDKNGVNRFKRGPDPSQEELDRRVNCLRADIAEYLPEFEIAVMNAAADKVEHLILHQDAFAANHDDCEYTLMGMAIKFAGLYGIEVHVTGKNDSTIDRD